ncbi:MAG: hypothetical protein IJA27_03770 [Lachnospiraceae bacterium]|nr:hypothetical protein [Lachnospiraceae bacterium]
MSKIKIKISNKTAEVYAPYHKDFIEKIKYIGGAKWNGYNQCWCVPIDTIDAVRIILKKVFGYDDLEFPETLKIKVTIKEDVYEDKNDIFLLGKCLCHASGKNSGGKPGEDVAYVEGYPTSGGSASNWYSLIRAGSVIILNNVNKSLYDSYNKSSEYDLEIIDNNNRDKLLLEKEWLLKRLAEIESLLTD